MKMRAMHSPFARPSRYDSGPAARWLHGAQTAAALLGAVLLLILTSPLVIWWCSAYAHPWQEASTGTLVIFSGPAADSHGMLADSSYWRAVYAARAWREGHFKRVLIVGTPSAREMAQFLAASGVPPQSVSVIDQTTDTRQAALTLAAMAPQLPAPLSILTSDFHIPRASAAFRKAGLAPRMLPFPDGMKRGQATSWYKRLSVFAELLGETSELARYRWNGWI
jgi:uncharacterized SAM-binding protein YcdF (DUF218 family)